MTREPASKHDAIEMNARLEGRVRTVRKHRAAVERRPRPEDADELTPQAKRYLRERELWG